jgi:oligopeptidase A
MKGKTMNPNPLLADPSELTDFATLRPEHVTPAVDALLARAEAALETAAGPTVPADYDAMSAALDIATEKLDHAWGAVTHLNNVSDTPELRATYNHNLPRVTDFHTRLASDERLYAKYKTIAASASATTLGEARRKALDNALRDFVLSGAELHGEAKERFAKIQERSAELGQAFGEHVLDATDRWAYLATAKELEGVPQDVLDAIRVSDDDASRAGPADEIKGWRVTLKQPVYVPVMQYAADRALRRRVYRAYTERASELGPPELDNTPVMRELLALRDEEAALLGHPTFAHVSLVPKMAPSVERALDFMRDLARRAKPFAERDLERLRTFAAHELGLPDLRHWDIAYASEKLEEAEYAFSKQEVKQYFTEPAVLAGLFRIIETIFEVKISPDTAPTWHPDVRFFRVERDGAQLAQFYLDPYARPGKRPGAWMDDARHRWRRPGGALQTPVAHLVCNFAPPVGAKPALLTHDDVITLFHEFGHGLHLMLSQVDDLGVSGLSGVEWDAVELPSQFMENFCWEWDVLEHMTAHVDTGATLPRALFDKMVAAKNFQSGMQTVRQLEFALFDMRIHAEPGSATSIQSVLDEVRAEVAVLEVPETNRFQHSFSHIFGGGYAAGYYSYKWAEVLSADAWSAFEEEGTLSTATGRRLRQEIFERGGSRSAMENFVAFRGREPSLDALMRHQGMTLAMPGQSA